MPNHDTNAHQLVPLDKARAILKNIFQKEGVSKEDTIDYCEQLSTEATKDIINHHFSEDIYMTFFENHRGSTKVIRFDTFVDYLSNSFAIFISE